MSAKVTSGTSSSTRSASFSSGSSSRASRPDGSTMTRCPLANISCANAPERRITLGLPPPSATIRRPSSSTWRIVRTEPSMSVPRCSTNTMFSLSSTQAPAVSRDALTLAATGTTSRLPPVRISADACWTPSSSVIDESTLTIVAKVFGGWAICDSCAFALVSSLPARDSACASAWFLAISWSLAAASSRATFSRIFFTSCGAVALSAPVPADETGPESGRPDGWSCEFHMPSGVPSCMISFTVRPFFEHASLSDYAPGESPGPRRPQ